jgi:alkanesulfonate monooxygenase SsuD/methylene tetrahydromethanopterin reductase-like flavin-dependent oxidoreductase (luciferase family)
MQVAMKEASARRAAERGWPAFIPAFTPPKIGGLDPMSHVRKYFDQYRTMLEAAGHADAVVKRALNWSTHTYQCVHLAPSDDQARAEVEIILRAYQDAVEQELIHNRRAEELSGVKIPEAPNALSEDWIATWCLHGSPETVAAKLLPYAELGIGNVLGGFTTGPLTAERLRLADQSLELLAKDVMPLFRDAP